jgi:hypothetical protein
MTTHLHPAPRWRMSGAMPQLPQHVFMVWCSLKAQGQLYLYLCYIILRWIIYKTVFRNLFTYLQGVCFLVEWLSKPKSSDTDSQVSQDSPESRHCQLKKLASSRLSHHELEYPRHPHKKELQKLGHSLILRPWMSYRGYTGMIIRFWTHYEWQARSGCGLF